MAYEACRAPKKRDGRRSKSSRPSAQPRSRSKSIGDYAVTVNVKQAGAVVRTLQHLITVTSLWDAEIAARNSLNGFLAALADRQLDVASAHMTETAAKRYAPMFAELAPRLGTIVAEFSEPITTFVGAGIVEFVLVREVDGVQRAFPAYVLLEADGQWRVESL